MYYSIEEDSGHRYTVYNMCVIPRKAFTLALQPFVTPVVYVLYTQLSDVRSCNTFCVVRSKAML